MQLHEFQAKELFGKAGVKTQRGIVVTKPEEIDNAISALTLPVVVKAQVHAGGRGKAGGIKFSPTAEEARTHANNILGMQLITKQTGEEGLPVNIIYIVEAIDIASELYLSILTDRSAGGPVLIASRAGGMNIEEVAEETPEALLKLPIDLDRGITDYQCREVHFFLSDGSFSLKETTALLKSVWKVYADNDATLVEINPVAVTGDGELMALDGKMSTDDNASFRHPEWAEFEIPGEKNAAEAEAEEFGLNYIKLDNGSIGCMVNGAGLAMATMDVISLYGSKPANFLDVGGGATTENVTAAFKILLRDPDVKVILVNIFGGIMKCDVIAEGIIAASKNVDINVPLVVRLEGTRVEEGMKLIEDSDLNCVIAKSLNEAAEMAVGQLETV